MINDCDSKCLQNKHTQTPQVQLETQVTPVLPQQRLAKFVDDDLMLCHRGRRRKERMCKQKTTKHIGERDKYKQIKPEYLSNISVNRTGEHARSNSNRIFLTVDSVRGQCCQNQGFTSTWVVPQLVNSQTKGHHTASKCLITSRPHEHPYIHTNTHIYYTLQH